MPVFKKDDVIILTYDSDFAVLSFSKENDNGKLDAQIYNLPKMNAYYWFVGHGAGTMSVTVVNWHLHSTNKAASNV